MTYLLDVNVLIALGVRSHESHSRVAVWVQTLSSDVLATCSITELGFVRVLAQVPAYGLSVAQARTLLQRMKESSVHFLFVPDTHDASRLPAWVKSPKQITDGHLARLARGNGAVLATLDRNIPDSFLIPE
jgi:toxin-antitoxin system PIN domain toxin